MRPTGCDYVLWIEFADDPPRVAVLDTLDEATHYLDYFEVTVFDPPQNEALAKLPFRARIFKCDNLSIPLEYKRGDSSGWGTEVDLRAARERRAATLERLGLLPSMLNEEDPRSAREQLDAHYQHGGGWNPIEGFTLHADNSLSYPGDPPMYPIAQCNLRAELVLFYDHAWVAIVQPDRMFEVGRMD